MRNNLPRHCLVVGRSSPTCCIAPAGLQVSMPVARLKRFLAYSDVLLHKEGVRPI